MSRSRTQTALGAFYRRLACRIGKAKAITATARKLAILVYRSLKGDLVYDDPAPPRTIYAAAKRFYGPSSTAPPSLGFGLVDRQTGEVLEEGVS